MSGKIFEHWLTYQQSCSGLFTAMNPNEKRGAIRTYRDITLPPQERFQILIRAGMNIEVSKKVPWKTYIEMKDDLIKVAADLQRKDQEEEAFVEYHKFLTLFVEKLRKGPEYLNCLSKGTRSKINKMINRVFDISETLKSKLLRKYNKEYEGYLADKKRREDEEAENEAFWQDIKNTIKNSPEFAKWSSLVERFVDGVEKDSGEVGSTLASASKSAEESLAESTPQEAYEEVTPNTSSDKQGGETKMVESPGQNSKGLHTVVLPKDLCKQFLRSARKNTKKGIETCGVLCGTLVKDEYHVSHVIIPVQKGGPDYCYAQNEEGILFVQEELGLLTLGWIHTHPTQTAFLSSVDVHTHFSYQIMLPEAIAVVCSPKYKQTGIFTLTPFGLNEISCCPQRGFHPHNQDSAIFCVRICEKEIELMSPASI